MRPLPLLLAVLAGLALTSVAHAATSDLPTGVNWYKDPKVGATWTQASIKETDGTVLHADVLRPADLPAGARTPVILSIGPYFNHSGQTGPAGPVEGTAYTPAGETGPSNRFEDFVVESRLMQRGYTYVMVDLRGFGGSTGCLDWGGPGEQADVKSAVEWAARQSWSTGSVGMYGKSYDAVTGLIGEATQPAGLKAIVSQEPVYDLYDYLYTNGVRYENSLATPALYDAIAGTPGVIGGDTLTYQTASVTTPDCMAQNYLPQATNSEHGSDYWKVRDFIAATKGHRIPLFLTQGFLENNTKPEGAWDFFNGLAGPKRAWFGMWDHIRGNDVSEGDDAAPSPWFDQVMRWYDHYVRDVPLADAPVDRDPAVEVETGNGTWRAEQRWPEADSKLYATELEPGTYDDLPDAGTNEGGDVPGTVGAGDWTISPPLLYEAQYSGVPHVRIQASAVLSGATMSVDTYDVAPDGSALLLSRGASLVPSGGVVDVDLYGNDWTIPAGHRIGIRVGSADNDWWTPTNTLQPVTVTGGTVSLPFLQYTRPDTIPGKVPARLAEWKQDAPFTLDAATIAAATDSSFALPPARVARPKPSSMINASIKRTKGARLKARIAVSARTKRHGRRVVVYGNAPTGAKLVVRLLRYGKLVRTKKTTAKYAAFRVTFSVRHGGRYRARVTATQGRSLRLKTVTKAKRLR